MTTTGNSGSVVIGSGYIHASGTSGLVSLKTGSSPQATGSITLQSGASLGTGSSGNLLFSSGTTDSAAYTGAVSLVTGASTIAGNSGTLSFASGASSNGGTGSAYVATGSAAAASAGSLSLLVRATACQQWCVRPCSWSSTSTVA